LRGFARRLHEGVSSVQGK